MTRRLFYPNSTSSFGATLATLIFTLLLNVPLQLQAQCDADAGSFSTQQICFSSTGVKLTAVPRGDAAVPASFQTIYVLTSGEDLVIQAVDTVPAFDLDPNPTGLFTVHTLVYDTATLDLSIVEFGVTTGGDVNSLLIQGGGMICASLDVDGVKFQFGGCEDEEETCEAEAGSLIAGDIECLDSTLTLTATQGDAPVVPDGYQLIYVLTSGEDLVIQAVDTLPSFTVDTTGIFTIHTLVYDTATLDLSIVEFGVTTGGDVNALLIQGGGDICAALDVMGAMFNVVSCDCPIDAGSLVATEDEACLEDSTVVISAMHDVDPVVPDSFQVIYVLTSGENLIIQQVNTEPTFTVDTTGLFTIHTLVYDTATLNLDSIEIGVTTGGDVNTLLIQGGGDICGALDVTGAPVTVITDCPDECEAMAGTLMATDAEVCLEDSTVMISATRDEDAVIPTGYQLIYVLTSGSNLIIQQVNSTPEFTVDTTGLFTIHTLVYDTATLDLSIVQFGVTTGGDVNALLIQGGGDICAALDVTGAPVTVVDVCPEECAADAGTLMADSEACLENDSITLEAMHDEEPTVPAGFQVIYVLTSDSNLIIQQVNTEPSFTVDTTGLFTIHTLVYDTTTLDLSIVQFGVTTGGDVNALLIQGGGDICGSLDVAGAPVLVVEDCEEILGCGPTSGRLTYTSAGAGFICKDDRDAVIAGNVIVRPFVPMGYRKLYVLTSGSDMVIEQVNHIPIFAVETTGMYRLHTLVYDPNTLDLSIIQFGVTKASEVNALLVQGGGDICASLDLRGLNFWVRGCIGGGINTYPNPTTERVNIEIPASSETETVLVELLDLTGNVVKTWRFDGGAAMQENLDINDLENGIYVLRISFDGRLVQQKRIVKAG